MGVLDRIYEILTKINSDKILIDKIRYSPDKSRLIVDIQFNRALTIQAFNNTVLIQGDKLYSKILKQLIEEELNNVTVR